MRTFTIEEGEFVTDGRVESDGTVIGELTNYRGTRRWAVKAEEIGLGKVAEVVAPVVAFALDVAPPVSEPVIVNPEVVPVMSAADEESGDDEEAPANADGSGKHEAH
jgi:hypothetical protein